MPWQKPPANFSLIPKEVHLWKLQLPLTAEAHENLGSFLQTSEMERALTTVRTGEICRAVRPVKLNGVTVKEGQIIGLMGRELKVAGDAPNDVLVSLLRDAGVSEGDLVTLYWGEPSTQDDADSARRLTEAGFPGVEVEIVPGGQPHYHYLASVE